MANVHARYIDTLETEGWLDRPLEFLPSDRQIAERQLAGSGLHDAGVRRADRVHEEHQRRRDGEERPARRPDARRRPRQVLPVAAAERFADAIKAHPLRREIISTVVVNQMVNLSGISFDHRMTEDTGASVVDVTRAWLASRDIFDFVALWNEIDRLDGAIPLDTQLDLFLDCRRMVERGALWVLRHRRPPFDLAETVAYRRGSRAVAAMGRCSAGG